jgi:hypothetical protein
LFRSCARGNEIDELEVGRANSSHSFFLE